MHDTLNDFHLDNAMIAALYGRSLIQETAVQPAKTAIRFLGNNARHVVILVQSPNNTFLPEDELAFLSKMLGACQLHMGDVAIVNLAVTPADTEVIRDELQASKLILFGISRDEPAFHIVTGKNTELLYSPALSELMDESAEARQKKTRLWTALKQLFRI